MLLAVLLLGGSRPCSADRAYWRAPYHPRQCHQHTRHRRSAHESIVWLVLLFCTYPCKRFELDVLSIVSAFVHVCVYLGTLLVKLHGDVEVNLSAFIGTPLSTRDVNIIITSTFSFRNSSTIITLIIIFASLVIALVLLALGQRMLVDGRAQVFRLADGRTPDLTLRRGTSWHLFLSHGESSDSNLSSSVQRAQHQCVSSSDYALSPGLRM